MASFPDKMEDSEGQILLKNEISPLPEVYEMQEFNNCKVKDLTSLLEFVITLVIIEINGANFAPIFF